MDNKKCTNKNLIKARKNKNDDFYSRLSDIEHELKYYKEHFKDKVVFCNCDDPERSNFWKYFKLNFTHLGLKKLIATYYANNDDKTHKAECTTIVNDNGFPQISKTPLQGDGDFRSTESIELLKESDIVVTSPPFSLFREYLAQLIEYNKQFLIVGSQNAIAYKETFKLIETNQIWLGCTVPKGVEQPEGETRKFCNNTCWFTNLKHNKRNEKLILYKTYYGNENNYPKYDNYDAINVDKINEIPMDYSGLIGVPISFLNKYNPEQFEIVGIDMYLLKELTGRASRFILNGNTKYARIVIKNKIIKGA